MISFCFHVLKERGVVPEWGKHAGFQWGICHLWSFPPSRQCGDNHWVSETFMMLKSHSDEGEVRYIDVAVKLKPSVAILLRLYPFDTVIGSLGNNS